MALSDLSLAGHVEIKLYTFWFWTLYDWIWKQELCTNDERVITKMYKLLLKFTMEEKQVKEFMKNGVIV